MNYNFIKRMVICFVIGFFTVSTTFVAGCAPKRVVVAYEKDGNHGYSEVGHKHEYEKKDEPQNACHEGADFGQVIYPYHRQNHYKNDDTRWYKAQKNPLIGCCPQPFQGSTT